VVEEGMVSVPGERNVSVVVAPPSVVGGAGDVVADAVGEPAP
jgi:hypothetical protein